MCCSDHERERERERERESVCVREREREMESMNERTLYHCGHLEIPVNYCKKTLCGPLKLIQLLSIK